ncbi:N-acetyltransferase [uncultured Rhodospira sp.]|uniref:GNAT family N-acetyltransferase n=1 Tax=uncultured Rhodospira sp. TaxID=1936189 RepID=UPI0026057485|nr:GNAT family N-acetyltransferase [uncultured Rhodospira sp.]
MSALMASPSESMTVDEAMRRPIGPGRLRETVTDMAARTPPDDPPAPLPTGVSVARHAGTLTWATFAPLFHAVGAPWLWRDRLTRSPAEQEAHLADPGVVVHVLHDGVGAALGFCEMDCRDAAAGFRVLYFGLVPDAIGGGLGRALFARALADAWHMGPVCIRLDTCTHDHPRAVDFYRRFGFSVTGRRVVEADDPRLTGLLPRDAAAHVPLAPLVERPPALRTDAG